MTQAAAKSQGPRPSSRLKIFKTGLWVTLSLFLIAAGANHFRDPAFYKPMMPPVLPYPDLLIALSGAAEIIIGLGFWWRRYRWLAAWAAVALFVAVFPANIYASMHPELFPALSEEGLYIRLPLQFVLIYWAYVFTPGCRYADEC